MAADEGGQPMTEQKVEISINDPDRLAEGFLVDYVFDPNPDGKLSIGQARYKLKHWQGEFYLWDAGRYVRLTVDEMRLRVKQFVRSLNQLPDAEQIKISTHLVANILLCIAGMDGVFLPGTRLLNSWEDGREKLGIQTFVFNNATVMLDPEQGGPVQVPHTPDYFTTVKLPYDFDPNASPRAWVDFLLDVLEGDAERVILLQQFVGYLLTPTLRQHKFLLIAGEGANGKGVFCEVVERMLGRENVSHIPLAEFGQRFSLATSLGKLANIVCESGAEISTYAENVLATYTAGDSMSFFRKYLDPIDAVPTAKVILSTNELPKFQDKTQGVWRRLIFCPFEKTYTEKDQDKNLADKLAMHLPGVLNWALEGIGLLKEYAGFVSPNKCVEALADYQLRMNPARGYLRETYELESQAEGIPCNGVYKAYTVWCDANGHRPLNSSNFGREVRRVYPNAVKMRRTGADGRRTAVYVGMQKVDSVECLETANGIAVIANP